MADATTTTDTTASTGSDTAAAGDPVCSSCGLPLHTLRSGPTGEIRDGGIVWLTVLGCQNQNERGTQKPCAMAGQEQSRVENVVPTIS